MGLDENGTAEIKSIVSKIKNKEKITDNDRFFTLTGVSFNQAGYTMLKERMNAIKYRYWKNGVYPYKGGVKRVCFHSSEIRRSKSPFYGINRDAFMEDISGMIREMPTRVISCFVDKEKLCRKYKTPDHPYDLAIAFLLERFCAQLNKNEKNGAIILEARGNTEDKAMLNHILHIIEKGTNKNPSSHFSRITGVYFNPKWSKDDDDKTSYVILELADLMSYPIHKHYRNGGTTKDLPFEIVERKLLRYPNPFGWGIKLFPK